VRHLAVLILILSGCGGDVLTLRYHLEGIDAATIASVQTTIVPVDPERFAAATDVVTIDDETRFLVSCGADDCAGRPLVMLIDRQPPVGGAVPDEFVLQFRSAASSPQHLFVGAGALAVGALPGAEPIARSLPVETAFAGASIDLYIRPKTLCGTIDCAAGQACCHDRCIDVSGDANNCGDCDRTCAAGEACGNGRCGCAGGNSCPHGETCCTTGCVDTRADEGNCSGCGLTCGEAEVCTATGAGGHCKCGAVAACAAGQHCCGDSGGCVDATSGCKCGDATCQPNQFCCGTTCVDDLKADAANCGTCGHACTLSPDGSPACSNGHCQCNGSDCDKDCCPSGCTDRTIDTANCGACGNACKMGETCGGVDCTCKGGARCGPTQTCCALDGCVDLGSDPNNCGTCGHKCAMGESCSNNSCVPAACVCSNGNTCLPGTTTCTCGGGSACTGMSTCCGGACVTLDTTAHCGDCSVACGSGETCDPSPTGATAFSCQCGTGGPCGAGYTCCGSSCVNLATNKVHCGGCGIHCATGEDCVGMACTCGTVAAPPQAGAHCNLLTQFCNYSMSTCVTIDVQHCPTQVSNYRKSANCTTLFTPAYCCGFCPTQPVFSCQGSSTCPKNCLTRYP
jgi:hypothetical protein